MVFNGVKTRKTMEDHSIERETFAAKIFADSRFEDEISHFEDKVFLYLDNDSIRLLIPQNLEEFMII